jgi:transcriptional regulator with XRE-family HTH domain
MGVESKPMESGKQIRALREDRSIKPSDIERITRNIADARGNPDYYVSHSTLADIEAGSIPSIHKLFSLSLALRVGLTDLLAAFGIDPVDAATVAETPSSALATPAWPVREGSFRFQLNFDTQLGTDQTTLLRLQSREFASLPPVLRERFDPTRYRYAFIGSKDDSMADLLPPRSLVEIDTAQKNVEVFAWHTLRERPIYLVWHPHGHTCCWCQLEGKELMLIPHPLSQERMRRFKMPNEANVIGRVTNAWLPFDALSAEQEAAS